MIKDDDFKNRKRPERVRAVEYGNAMLRKIILAFAVFAGTGAMVNAQDVITLKNGDEISAKVLEIGIDNVRYKKYSNLEGPTYTIKKSDIFRIITLANGELIPPDTKKKEKSGDEDPVLKPTLRKGYVGIGLGGSFLTDSYSAVNSTGFQFNVNFGYRFWEYVGMTSTIIVTSYEYGSSGDASVGVVGLLVGPLFTKTNSTQTMEYDLRPVVGIVSGTAQSGSVSTTTEDSYWMLGLGATVRWNCSKRMSISGNLDYYHNIPAIGITAGVNFRF